MGVTTGIEWCDSTWNPLRGCSRVSEGCRHCYAEQQAGRFCGEGQPFQGFVTRIGGEARWTGNVGLVKKHLLDPLKWGPVRLAAENQDYDIQGPFARPFTSERRRRIFVNSMSDLFHENVTDEMRDQIFAVMALCPQHDFLVLTKRPDRMLRYLTESSMRGGLQLIARRAIGLMMAGMITEEPEIARYVLTQKETVCISGNGDREGELCEWPLPNVWLGVSVENQHFASDRIWPLLATPAAVRFVSCEPLLGPVDLDDIEAFCKTWRKGFTIGRYLDWVICGGESGPYARPMHPDWVRSLRDQCANAQVPFFFKQWGEWEKYIDRDRDDPDWRQDYTRVKGSKDFCFLNLVGGSGFHGERLHVMQRVGKRAAGSLLDGCDWKQFPEVR